MKQPQKYTGVFRYAGKDIAFDFWLLSDGDLPADAVIFLGAGQVGAIPRWVAAAAGTGVVVVGGVPHWEAHASKEDTEKFSKEYLRAALRIVLDTFKLSSIHVIAESQATPSAVMLANAMPDKIGNLVLIRPLGFTVQAFGESEQSRLKTFRRRILRTYLQFPQSFLHDPRNLAVKLIVFRAMLREPSLASLNKKYAVGISYDLLEDCQHAAKIQQQKGNRFTILLSEKDRMFPPKEVLAALSAANITGVNVEVVAGTSHSSLAVRSSRAVLRQAIAYCRK